MTRRLLILGRNGQLASALKVHPSLSAWQAEFLDRGQADFCDTGAVLQAVRERLPCDAIINAVAFNDVDEAESDSSEARQVNTRSPEQLANLAAEAAIPLLHVSTDFVFPGRASGRYSEADLPSPLNAYGQTKLAGESAVLAASRRHAVFRTSWVYNHTHRNFVTAMLNQIGVRGAVRVVQDQIGSPTHAGTLAGSLLQAAADLTTNQGEAGLYHLSDRGAVSRSALAQRIYDEAAARGMDVPTVVPIPSSDWPAPARRPSDTSLCCQRFESRFGITLPDWTDPIGATVQAWLDRDSS